MSKHHLDGLKIVLTGDFKSYTRREATKVLEELGADVTGSVSGKTKVIIVGKSPGSKLQKGKAKGLPILNEEEMLYLIGGKTLEEVLADRVPEESEQTAMPEALGFPRDGKYEAFFPGTHQLQFSGTFGHGLRQGSWKEFWSNGQLRKDYGWTEGLQIGGKLEWTEDGTQVGESSKINGELPKGDNTGVQSKEDEKRKTYQTDVNTILAIVTVHRIHSIADCFNQSQKKSVLVKKLLGNNGLNGDELAEIVPGTKNKEGRIALICAAIGQFNEEGKIVPQELLEHFQLMSQSPSSHVGWRTQADRTENARISGVNLSNDKRLNSFHFVADFLAFQPGFTCPALQPLRDALGKLTEEQRLSIFEKHLDAKKDIEKLLVVPFLYLVDSQELWERVFKIAIRAKDPVADTISWGFGEIGLRFLPSLSKHIESEKRADFKAAWQQGVVFALLRASLDGEVFDAEYDSYIQFGSIDPFIIEHLLYLLPATRADKILLNTQDWKHSSSVFKLAALRPTDANMKHAFEKLLEQDSKLVSEWGEDDEELWDDQWNLMMGFHSLPNAVDWMRWLLENGATQRFMYASALEEGLLETIEAEVKKGGKKKQIRKPNYKDNISKLVEAAKKSSSQKKAAKTEKIYALRRLRLGEDSHDLNVLGGAAPGVGLDRWPCFHGKEDEPMEHLYTIDLATIPELQSRYKNKRTLSVFCYQPQENEASIFGSGWTAVLFSSQKEIDAVNVVPASIKPDMEARFQVVPIDVDFDDEEIRNQVYGLPARVLGNEIWLQGDEAGGDFVMQFDERFCHMNLGDSGIMYVYAEDAFWQCH